MYRTRESRWCGITGIIVTFLGGKRKKQNQDEWIPCILEPEGSSKEYRKNCARLIQKIYEETFGLYFCFDPEVGRVLLEEMHLVQVDSQFNLLMHPDDRLSIHDCHQIVLARCHIEMNLRAQGFNHIYHSEEETYKHLSCGWRLRPQPHNSKNSTKGVYYSRKSTRRRV
jgi:hypothetical protein